jgi:probable rRNA maturation factor
MNDDPGSSTGACRPFELDILQQSDGWDSAIPGLEPLAEAAVAATLAAAGAEPMPALELSLCLADDAFLQELNARYRGKDRPTNVLSFSQLEGVGGPTGGAGAPRPLGDVALSLDSLRREAQEQGKSLRDHFAHLLVHGTLHLLGYDHETPGEAETMEALERRILSGLGVADPYAGPGERGFLTAEDAR